RSSRGKKDLRPTRSQKSVNRHLLLYFLAQPSGLGLFVFSKLREGSPPAQGSGSIYVHLSLDFQLSKGDNTRVERVGASLQFDTRSGEVPSGVAKNKYTRADLGKDVAMMNLRRAAVLVLVLAFAAMAQDYTPSAPLSRRNPTGESASAAERLTLTV